MDQAVQAFRDEWKSGDRITAREMARIYIEAHETQLAPLLDPLTLENCVALIDVYRAQSRDEDVQVLEMWLLTKYPPQKISGAADVSTRS